MTMRKPVERRGVWRRRLRRLVVFAAVLYLGLLLVLRLSETSLLFPRRLAGPVMSEAMIGQYGVERVYVEDDGARVEGWFVDGGGGGEGDGALRPAVLFIHGNAELIDHNMALAERYKARAISTLMMELRGYGRSGGSPSEAAIAADGVRFYDLLAQHAGVDPARIVIHGRSIGTGAASQIAARITARAKQDGVTHAPAALILESPFVSIAAFAPRYGVPSFMVRNAFHTDRALPTLACPVLLLAGRQDEIVPFSHAETLHRQNPASTLVELDGTHNSGLSEQGAYWEAVDGVLGRVSGGR